MRRIVILFASLCFLTVVWYDAAMAMGKIDKKAKFIREVEGIREYELLSNGLKVLLLEVHSAPVATVVVTYLVGSRHETAEFRGGAHLLEHMMFKGTKRHSKELNTSIARLLQETGALLNATTWTDGTNYFETLPIDQLDLALEIEADRMRGSLLRGEDLQSEMPVVQSEFDRMDNSPVTAIILGVWDKAFETHPYHFPIIGIREDLEKMPIESLRRFYDTYYWPNNATLAVVGDFDTEVMLETIHAKFKDVPKSEKDIPKMTLVEPPQNERRMVRVEREDKIEAVVIANKCPGVNHEDTVGLDILGFILSRGKSSRLYRTLVDQGLAVEVRSENSKSHDPGLCSSEAFLLPDTKHEEVEKIILSTYEDIKSNGVTTEEFQRAKNQLNSQVAFARDGSYSLGIQLSLAIAGGDWRFFSSYLYLLQKFKGEDIQKLASRYLTPETSTVGYLISKNAEKKISKPVQVEPVRESNEISELKREPQDHPSEPSNLSIEKRIQEKQIGGIKVLTAKTDIKDVVTLMGSFSGAGQSYAKNPLIASLATALLDEGTQKHNKFEIASLLDSRGAELSFDLDHQRVGFHARCLKKDVGIVMELIAEQLKAPLFSHEEFEKQKQQQLVRIHQALNNTAQLSYAAMTQTLYPENHPNYIQPYEEQLKTLESISLEDVKDFYEKHYGTQSMTIVATGDVPVDIFEGAVKDHFSNWAAKPAIEDLERKALPATSGKKKSIPLPDKIKVDALFGHTLPLSRLSQDYLPAHIAVNILGGDFSARLSNTVRDDQGLTYSIYSEIDGIDKDVEGHWQTSVILNNQVLAKGIQATQEQLKLFIEKGITQEELDGKKRTLLGKFKVSLSTTGGLAHRLLRNEELGLGANYISKYSAEIEALDLKTVNSVIKKYFSFDKLHTIICGSIGGEAT